MKNVLKRKARPKRSIETPGNDHELGLWIDSDVMRKHHSSARTIVHDPLASTNNRYLELADLALATKAKKKAKAATSDS